MNILLLHNYYQQSGGEDVAFQNEAALLESKGHKVVRFCLHNDAVQTINPIALGAATLWNARTYASVRALIRREHIGVCHFHNTFPLISPAAYYAARKERVPVVQTLHNYRLLCPGATLYRDGRVCEDCLGKRFAWPAVRHACYRGSIAASGTVAAMLGAHRVLGTWSRAVAVYVALTGFAKTKFIQGGLPAAKIAVKQNFLHPDPGPGKGAGGFGLFVGRLAPEKGLDTLITACQLLGGRIPIKIAGDGPLGPMVAQAAATVPGVEWLGRLDRDAVQSLLGEAAFLVAPSQWYEGMPFTIMEALAKGTPVIAARLGGLPEMVRDGSNGYLFRHDDPDHLAEKISRLAGAPADLPAMRERTRKEFELHYTAEANYTRMQALYARAAASVRN